VISGLSIGLSGIQVSQKIIDLLGQNIANAQTPDYHRQVADLAGRYYGPEIGSGVEVKLLRRLSNSVLDAAVTRSTFESQHIGAQLETLRHVQSLLAPGEGSVHDLLERFFNQVEQLSVKPSDLAQRRVVLNSAVSLSQKLNGVTSDLLRLSEKLDEDAARHVAQINALTPRIAALNEAIERNTIQGLPANDLRDQRDRLVNQLAELADARVVEQDFGLVNVLVGGTPLVTGNSYTQIEYVIDNTTNEGTVRAKGVAQPLGLVGGKLAGLLKIRNGDLKAYRARLDTFTRELVRQLDTLHATGLGLTGPHTFLAGHRAVSNPLVPLAQANLGFPPQAGSLFVTVSNLASGTRTLNQIAINPATQSLQDLATALSAIPNMQAVVDAQTNTLRILAAPGFAVDFAGRLASSADNILITGTSTVQLGGAYTGSVNDTYTYTVVGSGTVGVTPNLRLEVRNSAGTLLNQLNIGQGYEPGGPLTVDGVTVRLSSGTINNGDSFQARVVAQPDTAGILTALGLSTFFTGKDTSNIAVRQEILDRPELLAASRTGQAGDGSNLRRVAGLRDLRLLNNGTQTLRGFYAGIVADVGSQVQDLNFQATAQQALGARIMAERQAVSGVDPNEEMVHLLQFQRAFEMSAKYLTVINETLDELANIIR
jgi:flagellar hook-associated protein 1 FlgK